MAKQNRILISINHVQNKGPTLFILIQHEREHGHSHHGHYHQHRHDQPQEDENCFIQEPYRNLLVHVRMFQMQYVFL